MGFDLTGFGALFDLGGKIIDKIFPDKDAADRAKLEMLKLEQEGKLEELKQSFTLLQGQQDINKVEAASSSLFVAGWRPFIGWTCGAGLFYNYIGQPLFTWAANLYFSYYPPVVPFVQPPALNTGELVTLLFGMLGIAGYRSFEKVKKVAS